MNKINNSATLSDPREYNIHSRKSPFERMELNLNLFIILTESIIRHKISHYTSQD